MDMQIGMGGDDKSIVEMTEYDGDDGGASNLSSN